MIDFGMLRGNASENELSGLKITTTLQSVNTRSRRDQGVTRPMPENTKSGKSGDRACGLASPANLKKRRIHGFITILAARLSFNLLPSAAHP
jgi:hypothetical protein